VVCGTIATERVKNVRKNKETVDCEIIGNGGERENHVAGTRWGGQKQEHQDSKGPKRGGKGGILQKRAGTKQAVLARGKGS